MLTCPKFAIHELVYPDLYNHASQSGETHKLWNAIDIKARLTLNALRTFLGISITINNYKWGGNFKESGLRHPDTKTGALVSQHKYGCAFDPKFNGSWTREQYENYHMPPELAIDEKELFVFDSAGLPTWNPENLRLYMDKIGCFEEGFLNRTDSIAKPFLNIRRIEWIANMGWFHFDTFQADEDQTAIIIVGKRPDSSR